jgi:predicted HicB family RNase H-like nuclease
MTAKTSTERSRERRARLDAEKVSEVRGLYPSAVTRATWQSCADAAGLSLNQWLERAANAQVKRDLRKGK